MSENAPSELSKFLQIIEVDRAHIFISELFQRKFHSPPPDFPKHFVAFYKPDPDKSHVMPVGYVHQTPYLDCHLCGGLVIDDRLYRTISASHRKVIRNQGGIAECLLRESFEKVGESKAIWGHVGNKQAEKVDLRVGFIHTRIKPIMVCWRQNLSDQEKEFLLQEIVKIGPF